MSADRQATLLHGRSTVSDENPREASQSSHGTDRYEELAEIDRGGCGLVIRAFDHRLGRDVAIKKILPEVQGIAFTEARFSHEARITARLAHPGIVPVHDLCEHPDSGQPFYAMKLLRGATLEAQIEMHHAKDPSNHKDRSLRDLVVRFQQVCQTLSYAHGQGIVHRDLKPANVLIGEFGETTVLDWGLAKELFRSSSAEHPVLVGKNNPCTDTMVPGASHAVQTSSPCDGMHEDQTLHPPFNPELTSAGAILGTPAYMSPEQARGDSNQVDCRSDVFSLGVILYEILTGKSPFICPTQHETLQHIQRSEHIPVRTIVPRVDRALAAICEKSLSVKPSDRYANANDLEQDVASYLAGDAVSAYPEPWWARVDRIASKHRSLVWSAVLSLFVVASVATIAAATIRQAHRNEVRARNAAEQAMAEKSHALHNEKIAHQEAVTQLQSARDSVDSWLIDLDGDLKLYPGMNALRHQLLHRAEKHYSVLAEQSPDSPLMCLEIARAMIRQGDIDRAFEQPEQSLIHYRAAVLLLEKSSRPRDSDWWVIETIQRSIAQLGIADSLISLNQDLNASYALIQTAYDSLEVISKDSAQFRESRKSQARALQLRAKIYFQRGEHAFAERDVRKAIAILEYYEFSNDLESGMQSSIHLFEDLADYRLKQHHYAEAQEIYQRIIHTFDRLLDNNAGRPDWLESRALAKIRSAACNTQLVRPHEAAIVLEDGEEDLRHAWEMFGGENVYHDKIATVYTGLGHSLLLSGDLQQAESVLLRGISSLERVMQDRTSNQIDLQRMLQSQLWLATSFAHQNKSDFTRCLATIESLIEQYHSRHDWDGSIACLSSHYAWLKSRDQLAHCQIEDAKRTIDTALAFLSDEMANEHNRGTWHLWKGRLLAVLSSVYAESDDFLSSRESLLQARIHWTAGQKCHDPRMSTMSAIALLESWCEDENADSNELHQALGLAKSLVASHETLPTAWFWLAEVAWKNGQLRLGLEAFRKLERLRHRPTVEDRLLGGLLQKSLNAPSGLPETIQKELSELHCSPGTHAEHLMRCLLHK